MSFPVFWSPAAKEEYAEILKFLENKFGLEAALKFLDQTDEVISTISSFPNSGESTQKETVRK